MTILIALACLWIGGILGAFVAALCVMAGRCDR